LRARAAKSTFHQSRAIPMAGKIKRNKKEGFLWSMFRALLGRVQLYRSRERWHRGASQFGSFRRWKHSYPRFSSVPNRGFLARVAGRRSINLPEAHDLQKRESGLTGHPTLRRLSTVRFLPSAERTGKNRPAPHESRFPE